MLNFSKDVWNNSFTKIKFGTWHLWKKFGILEKHVSLNLTHYFFLTGRWWNRSVPKRVFKKSVWTCQNKWRSVHRGWGEFWFLSQEKQWSLAKNKKEKSYFRLLLGLQVCLRQRKFRNLPLDQTLYPQTSQLKNSMTFFPHPIHLSKKLAV